ncbi:MAG TPA: peptidase S24, partial [Allosphingosinicella sp.]
MDRNDPRETLERLLKERGEDFAGLSRLIGKNPAYIQQFIKRGTPRK